MRLFIILLGTLLPFCGFTQNAEEYFHNSARLYIGEKTTEAKQKLDEGIQKFPNDEKLRELRAKIKEDEKKKEEQQKKDEENKEDKDKKDQKDKDNNKKDKKDEKQKEQKDKEQQDKEQKDKEKQDKEKENKDNKDQKDKKDIPPSTSEKLKEMKMSEDKAKMVLEAMKNQEVQYLQQNKRKATKPKGKGKPDW